MGTPAGRSLLRRADRLRSAKDFQRLNRAGERRRSAHFVVLVGPGRDPERTRLGLTVSRRVGGSVERNRVKRRVREWFRRHRARLPQGRDVVVIARAGAAELDGVAVCRELGEALR